MIYHANRLGLSAIIGFRQIFIRSWRASLCLYSLLSTLDLAADQHVSKHFLRIDGARLNT